MDQDQYTTAIDLLTQEWPAFRWERPSGSRCIVGHLKSAASRHIIIEIVPSEDDAGWHAAAAIVHGRRSAQDDQHLLTRDFPSVEEAVRELFMMALHGVLTGLGEESSADRLAQMLGSDLSKTRAAFELEMERRERWQRCAEDLLEQVRTLREKVTNQSKLLDKMRSDAPQRG